jgi:hypothetical protein
MLIALKISATRSSLWYIFSLAEASMKSSEREAGSIAPGSILFGYPSLFSREGEQHAVLANDMECTGQMVYVCLHLYNAACH